MENATAIHFAGNRVVSGTLPAREERIRLDQLGAQMPSVGGVYDLWGISRHYNDDGLNLPSSKGRYTCLVEYPHYFVFASAATGLRLTVTKNELKARLVVAKNAAEACPFQLIPVNRAV